MPRPPGSPEEKREADRFELFLRERREPLLRFLLRMRVNEADAQDIAQESLSSLLRYRDSEPEDAWQALLYRIAINRMRDRTRQARTEGSTMTQPLPNAMVAEAVSPDASPEQHASDRQALARLKDAILRLPPRCRQAYLLHRIEGMTYPEIARRNGTSLKAVEKHISRALRLLRDQLDEYGVASANAHEHAY